MEDTNETTGAEVIETTKEAGSSHSTETGDSVKEKKKRRTYPFPTLSFEESLIIAKGIWKFSSGQKIRRITLFDHIGKSPESGPSRTLVTASSKYGITSGGAQADYLELTEDGRLATDPDESEQIKIRARFKLTIENNEYFYKLYTQYKDIKMPSKSVMVDFLLEQGLSESESINCIELFIVNATFIGILKVMAGAERILPIEQVIEEASHNSASNLSDNEINNNTIEANFKQTPVITDNHLHENRWNKICFYITPIGDEDSEERRHSDLFLNNIVEPALEEFGLEVIRADSISTPGMITTQIIEYILESKLVIADLSFHNPNVFYELSLRHTSKKPTVHLIRKSDKIPFDINDFRTIVIDTSSIYTLVPKLQTYQTEIAMQVRQILNNPVLVDNPISAYLEKGRRQLAK